MGETLSKEALAEQVGTILGGINILLATSEMSLRNRNVVKKMKENAEQMLGQLNPDMLAKEQQAAKEKRMDSNGNTPLTGMPDEAKLSVLQSYQSEVKQISGDLENYLKEDMDMFRIKVHGIKSASKQLGFLRVGESAEIMEMAAKTDNLSYIQRNMKSFLSDLRITLDEVQKDYENLQIQMERARAEKQKPDLDAGTYETSEKLFADLKAAFDGYEIDQIEIIIEKINHIPLGDQEKELLNKVKNAATELEYELGSKLLAEIGRQ